MRWAAAIAAVALLSVAWGQGLGSWAVDDAGRGAVLEAFAYPPGAVADEVALIVFCDADVPGGLNVNLWLGRPAGIAWPTSFEAATRREQDVVRRDRWSSDGDRLAAPAYYDEVGRVLEDLRSGGAFAMRAFVLEGAPDAAQPTYQFAAEGFAAAERQLACVAGATPAPPARPVAVWDALALGAETYVFAFGQDAGLYVVCDRGAPIVLFEVLAGPAFGRDFGVEFGGFARVLERSPFEGAGPVEVLGAAGDPSVGFLALDVSAAAERPIDVDAVFADGRRVPLVTVEGGDGFYAALEALPCAALGDGVPTPSASAPVPLGFWVGVLGGDGIAYEDPTVDAYLAIACFEGELEAIYVDPTFERPREEIVRLRFTGLATGDQEHDFLSLGGGRYAGDRFVALAVAHQAFFELGVAITWADDPNGRALFVFGGGDVLRERYEALPCTDPG